MRYHAWVPRPAGIGINHSYGIGGGRMYKHVDVRDWQVTTSTILKLEHGWQPLEKLKGRWWVALSVVAAADARADIDGPLKALIDAVFAALRTDDRSLRVLRVSQVVAHTRPGFTLELVALPVASAEVSDQLTFELGLGWPDEEWVEDHQRLLLTEVAS